MKEINIKHISNLHSDALRGLDFYKQEIGILKKRLEEIAADNTGHEVAESIERFQNPILFIHILINNHLYVFQIIIFQD